MIEITDLGSQFVNLLPDLLILWAHDRPPGKAMANEGPVKAPAAAERPDLPPHQREDCVVQRGAVRAVRSGQFHFVSSFDLI